MEIIGSYSQKLKVKCSPEKAFEALTTGIELWWGNLEGDVAKNGDEFVVDWGAAWYKFKVSGYMPGRGITWECIDANQIIDGLNGVEKEWVETKLIWNITPLDEGKQEISLIHEGLVPDFICYDVCSNAWNHFVLEELKGYLIG